MDSKSYFRNTLHMVEAATHDAIEAVDDGVPDMAVKLILDNAQVMLNRAKRFIAPPSAKLFDGLSRKEVEFVKNGQKIDAIKEYRNRTGQGLKESKDAVEAYIAKHSTACGY